jgi:hypothetical protein
MNNVWITNSQTTITDSPAPTGTDPWNTTGDDAGAFGYRGDIYYSNAWGPFATTPSGMVQMALDGIGRTNNTVFGNPSTVPDQRFNDSETWYADNFCNNTSNGAYYAPLAYMYGMFSFTKSMLLHDPGGVLSPIQYLRTQTPSVFTTNPSVPANTIDWYAALSSANGGQDPCNGIAQTLVGYQQTPAYGTFDGHWYGNDYYGYQFYFETAWALIMLQHTVFVSCINDLYAQGASGTDGSVPRVDLTWSAQADATSYEILRSTTNGGPYTEVTGGTTSKNYFKDTTAGLSNGGTYYYVVQPLNSSGTEICQSNPATATIPVPR